MLEFSQPEILTDRSRLQEIYHLRALAWEDLPAPANISRATHPSGFSDRLDESAVHWVSYNPEGEIIAAARLAVVDDLSEVPYMRIFSQFELPDARPLALHSHRSIHPDYRPANLPPGFDTARMRYQKENNIPFSLLTTFLGRTDEMKKYGWRDLGEIRNVDDPAFHFGHNRAMMLLLEDIRLP